MRHPILSVFASVMLAACQTPAPQTAPLATTKPHADDIADYAALAQSGEGTVYTLDPAASKVRIYAFRGGAAAKAGHNHIFAAPKFEGQAYAPNDGVSKARFDLRVRLDELTVDDPAWRAETGGAFAGERSASDIEGTLRNMLGKRGLDATQFPFVTLRSVSISGDWPILIAEVAVTLRDTTRTQLVMLRAQRSAERIEAIGTLVLKQSDFGVAPFSVLGGLLAVEDAVAISFELVGKK
ncbi:MAG: YceI family protein [Panacagrimonas sp.]